MGTVKGSVACIIAWEVVDGMWDAVSISAGVCGSGVPEWIRYAEGFFSVHPMFRTWWAVSRVSNIDESGLMMRWAFTAYGAPTVSVSLIVVSEIVESESVG